MTPTGPTLDQAPPDWAAYAESTRAYAQEVNDWMAARTRKVSQDARTRQTQPVYTQQQLDDFFTWLEA